MASVLDAIRDGVAEMFREFESVSQSLTYHVAGANAYDTATGAVTRPKTDLALKGFVLGFQHREIDGTVVRVGDKKILLDRTAADAAAVVAAVTFGPALEDRVTLGGIEHQVMGWSEDPARATVEIHVRRSV